MLKREKQILGIYLLLTAATLIAFCQVSQCDFINYDDPLYVTENIYVQNGITTEAVQWAFTTGHASNWHPLTWLSHMLDVQLFGVYPRWHHLTNLLFHIANTLLLFFVFHRMTKEAWKSAFVAALFALHPLHVESVAWVSERKDVLSTFFWMLTMAAYISYVEHRTEDGRRKTEGGDHPFSFLCPLSCILRYFAVLIFFALGLMSKPMLVTLPFVLLLLDYWPLRRMQGVGSGGWRDRESLKTAAGSAEREAGSAKNCMEEHGAGSEELEPSSTNKCKVQSGRKSAALGVELDGKSGDPGFQWALIRPLLLEKIPLFVLAALSCIVTFVAQQKGGAVASLDLLPPGVRIANAYVSYIIYVGKTIWPENLAVFYPHPVLRPFWQVLGAVILLVAVTLAVIRTAKRLPCLAVGWLWFAGTLLPVIGIIQVGSQAMADRYTYIPLIGLFVMAAWGIPELLKNWRYRKEALFASSALVLPCLAVVTWSQVGYWHSGISLYDHALKVTSHNDVIHCNRGIAYGQLSDQSQAISDFDRAIEINPKYATAYYNRGLAYGKLGNKGQAISDYNRAIDLNPNYADAYKNRGATYGMLGNYKQAIEDFDKAIKINPKYADAYKNRGVAYDKLGNSGQAIEDMKTAAKLDNEGAKNYLRSHGVNW